MRREIAREMYGTLPRHRACAIVRGMNIDVAQATMEIGRDARNKSKQHPLLSQEAKRLVHRGARHGDDSLERIVQLVNQERMSRLASRPARRCRCFIDMLSSSQAKCARRHYQRKLTPIAGPLKVRLSICLPKS